MFYRKALNVIKPSERCYRHFTEAQSALPEASGRIRSRTQKPKLTIHVVYQMGESYPPLEKNIFTTTTALKRLNKHLSTSILQELLQERESNSKGKTERKRILLPNQALSQRNEVKHCNWTIVWQFVTVQNTR